MGHNEYDLHRLLFDCAPLHAQKLAARLTVFWWYRSSLFFDPLYTESTSEQILDFLALTSKKKMVFKVKVAAISIDALEKKCTDATN